MMSNIERYNKFTNDMKNIWLDHFTWKGVDGKSPQNRVSLVNYEKQTGAFANMNVVHNAWDLFKEANKMTDDYVAWCCDNDYYDEDEQHRLRNFFIGAVGEYFFWYLINTVKCLLIKNHKSGKLERYDFDNVCPRLKNELDYGVDLTGMVSTNAKYYKCALQIKFWNPVSDTPITNKIAQSVHSDGILNEFIDNDDNKNIIVCWLGNTYKVSQYLVANEKLYKHIAFIDMKTLDDSINNTMPNFWEGLHKELTDISFFK